MKSYETPEYIFAKNPEEVRFAKLGIPRSFWKTTEADYKFRIAPFYGGKISSPSQRQQVKALIRQKYLPRYFIVVGSDPTDRGAFGLGCSLVREFLHKRSAIINIDDIPYFQKYPRFVVIHNLLSSAPPERLTKVRDILLRFKGCCRFLVVAGEKDPFKFATTKLGLYPDLVLRVKDIIPEKFQ